MKGLKIAAIITLSISGVLFFLDIPVYMSVLQTIREEAEEAGEAVGNVFALLIMLPFYLAIGIPAALLSIITIVFGWVRTKKGGSTTFATVVTCIGGFIIIALVAALFLLKTI